MTLYNAIKKIDSLSEDELEHCIQLSIIEIVNYDNVTKNYSPAKMEKYGIPYKKKLIEQRRAFEDKLYNKYTLSKLIDKWSQCIADDIDEQILRTLMDHKYKL